MALTAPHRPTGVPAVLVLRALGLGDALTGVPALRGLRRRFAGHPLVLAADGPPAALPCLPDSGGENPVQDVSDPVRRKPRVRIGVL